MKSIIFFLALQTLYFFLGISNASQISLIVLGFAVIIFAAAYIGVVIKEKRNRQRLIDTLLNTN